MESELYFAAILALADSSSSSYHAVAVAQLHIDVIDACVNVIRSIVRTVSVIRRDKRGGSVLGRRRRLKRLPSQWMIQYIGSPQAPPVYPPKHFRDTFGIPKSLFMSIMHRLGPALRSGPAADGRPGHTPEIQLLATLRILRTGSALTQFDDAWLVAFGMSPFDFLLRTASAPGVADGITLC